MEQNLIFHQLFEKETSTYTYLLGDSESKEAVLIDPVAEMIERDLGLVKELGLKLKYVLETHVHADHITAAGEIRRRTGAQIGVSAAYKMALVDLHLEEGQILTFGKNNIKIIHTPGHTSGCLTYHLNNLIFTGDALLVKGCGRTDFQEGSADQLFSSVREKLFKLSDETEIYPGHDYKGYSKSTVGAEKKFNPRLNLAISQDAFVAIMNNLNLPFPKKILEAVPANLLCGSSFMDNVPTVNAETIFSQLNHFKLIDVRRTDEFNNELGHIPSAVLATLGPDLDKKLSMENRKREIVFVCRSGKRSADATQMAMDKGFERVYNLQGGMIRWIELKFPTEING